MVLAATAACNNDEQTASDSPSTSAQVSPTAGSDPTTGGKDGKSGKGGSSDTDPPESSPTVDADLAVEPPGPMKGRVETADVLIFNQKPLSESLIKRIRGLDNVAAMETFGLANVVIENRALNVASVDPASFRRFTPTETASMRIVWGA